VDMHGEGKRSESNERRRDDRRDQQM